MDSSTIQQQISESYETGVIKNNDLVEIIKLCGLYLNLQTISNYAKNNNITYQGATKGKRQRVELFGTKYIIDND